MTKQAARSAYSRAGISPDQVSVVELHDCFSANELVTYEALGLCPPGQAGKYIDLDKFRDDVFRAYMMICAMVSGDSMFKYLKTLDKSNLVRDAYRYKMYENILVIPPIPKTASKSRSSRSITEHAVEATVEAADEAPKPPTDVLLDKVAAGKMSEAQYDEISSSFNRALRHIRSLGLGDSPDYDLIIEELETIVALYEGRPRL
jgi:hypothetical protein